MSPSFKNAAVALAMLTGTASCSDPKPEAASGNEFVPPVVAPYTAPSDGCYLGSSSGGADTIFIRLEGGRGAVVKGQMDVLIPEKDRRSGTLSGSFDADGIVHATYIFMQEGVTDSIRVDFTQGSRDDKALLIRPAAYDPSSGREYPDTTKGFSIRLNAVSCDAMPGRNTGKG